MSDTYEAGAPRVIVISLQNTTYHGARAKAHSMPVGDYVTRDKSDPGLIKAFYEHLLDWNVTFNGEPVEPNAKAGSVLDAGLVLSLAVGWIRGVQRIEYDRPNQQSPGEDPTMNGTLAGVELETL